MPIVKLQQEQEGQEGEKDKMLARTKARAEIQGMEEESKRRRGHNDPSTRSNKGR